MDNHEYAQLIAQTLVSPSLHEDELCFLHALHLRLLAFGDQAIVTGPERSRVLAIIAAQHLTDPLS